MFFFLQIFQHINVFRQDNSEMLLEFIKHYKQNPLEIFFFISIFTKNYFGFNIVWWFPFLMIENQSKEQLFKLFDINVVSLFLFFYLIYLIYFALNTYTQVSIN